MSFSRKTGKIARGCLGISFLSLAACQSDVQGTLEVGTTNSPATPAQVLGGQQYWDQTGTLQSGTMSIGVDVSGPTGEISFPIPMGFYSGTETATARDTNLNPGNILVGKTIFGITGTGVAPFFCSDDALNAASCATLPNRYVAANAGSNVTGQNGQLVAAIPEGFYDGNETVTAHDTHLIAANILGGVSIFGVTGSLVNQGNLNSLGAWPGVGCYGATPILPSANQIAQGSSILGVAGTYTGAVVNPTFTITGAMVSTRYDHTSTLLANGQVLVAGGAYQFRNTVLASAELYSTSASGFSSTGSLNVARVSHTATLLPNGQVLFAGGSTSGTNALSSAEIYDPSSGSFSPTGSMTTPRSLHTSTLLPNGLVLITGGLNLSNTPLSSAELYNPATSTFTATGSMASARISHTATLLPNGLVLIAAGSNISSTLATAELYNPNSGTFSGAGFLVTARSEHTATLLPNGTVLIAGGVSSGTLTLGSGETYNPNTNAFTATTAMTTARYDHTATLLPNGTVLIAGGLVGASTALSSAEIFNPSTNGFSTTTTMNATREQQTATLLPNGLVLISGGETQSTLPNAELYNLGAL